MVILPSGGVATGDAPAANGPPVLAIESSCDETSAAVLTGTRTVASVVVSSQVALHARFGGVVPELASRAHVMSITPVARQAMAEAGVGWSDLAGLAVTRGPGLVGSLLVGVSWARGAGMARNLPVIGVHHLAGHWRAPWLEVASGFDPPAWPCVALLVSGGHSALYHAEGPGAVRLLGRTLDDAAGEAWDKVSRLLGLGYPGGAAIDALAAGGQPGRWSLPTPLQGRPGMDLSFSGVKTAVLHAVARSPWREDPASMPPSERADLAAAFQAVMVGSLVERLDRAVAATGVGCVIVSGGVACNRALRSRLRAWGDARGVAVSIPPASLCTDNAAMIGAAGYARVFDAWRAGRGYSPEPLDVLAHWPLEEV